MLAMISPRGMSVKTGQSVLIAGMQSLARVRWQKRLSRASDLQLAFRLRQCMLYLTPEVGNEHEGNYRSEAGPYGNPPEADKPGRTYTYGHEPK